MCDLIGKRFFCLTDKILHKNESLYIPQILQYCTKIFRFLDYHDAISTFISIYGSKCDVESSYDIEPWLFPISEEQIRFFKQKTKNSFRKAVKLKMTP